MKVTSVVSYSWAISFSGEIFLLISFTSQGYFIKFPKKKNIEKDKENGNLIKQECTVNGLKNEDSVVH